MRAEYSEITEGPGQKATKEQLERLYHRYHFASRYIAGGEVLEVGCGSGIGLGYLAKRASRVVGGDIDRENVEEAAYYHRENRDISVLKLDAHNLPFDDECFDAILLFEVIYYLEKPEQFISEAHRLLKDPGYLIICTVNRNWKDFHPSKYSIKYFSVPELYALLQTSFSFVEILGAFAASDNGIKARAFSSVKKTASKLNLIPGSLKARERLKRIFIGSLEPIPAEIRDGTIGYWEPVTIASNTSTDKFKILYAVATKSSR